MAYKNLNGGSQKWSYSLAEACVQIPPPLRNNRGGVTTEFKSHIKRGLTILV